AAAAAFDRVGLPEGNYHLQVFGHIEGDVVARPTGSGVTPSGLAQFSTISNDAGWSAEQNAFLPSGIDLYFDVTGLPSSGSAYVALERIAVNPLG
ncbi:MAG: hypothetical protein ACOC3G_06000, partial [Phycisphaeraceae bacterium]